MWINKTRFNGEKKKAIDVLFQAADLFADLRDIERIRLHLKLLPAPKPRKGKWALVVSWSGGTIMRPVDDVHLGELYKMITRDLPGYVQT